MGAKYYARSAAFPSTFIVLLGFCLAVSGCASQRQAVDGSDYLAEPTRIYSSVRQEEAVPATTGVTPALAAPAGSPSPAAAHVQSQVAAAERSAPASQHVIAPMPARDETALSEDAVRLLLIQRSQASYSGSCACPYNTDRGGRRCGSHSAYSKPGGASPLCYPADVTAQMVAAYRGR